MKKNLDSLEYWDAFGRGLPVEKPFPKEAADYVVSLHIKIDKLEKEKKDALFHEKIAKQQFSQFCLEVSNLAMKHERSLN